MYALAEYVFLRAVLFYVNSVQWFCLCISLLNCSSRLGEKIVLEAIQELQPRAVIVDSIQTVYLPEATGSAGSVIQVVFGKWAYLPSQPKLCAN